MTTNAQKIQQDRYGTDLQLSGFSRGANGSLPTVGGKENLAQAIEHLLLDDRGSLLHRPDHGTPLWDYVGASNSPAQRAQLANAIYRSLSRDPRIDSVQVQAGLGETSSSVLVEIAIVPFGENETQTLTFTVPVGV